ncbi:MAG TPA: hypothetical protein VEK08_12010 [Planctomycetota bacterium]|nr:hypothetical protein [Planctomycetota bacterium]
MLRIHLLSAFLILLSTGLCAGQGRARGERWPDKLKEGDAAPDFTLKSPDGKTTFQLSAHKDKKPVVIVLGSYT